MAGEFEFASDLHRDGALFGATLRSPHASARIRSIDVAPALRIPGIRCALTHEDVPGRPTYGLEVPDQPVLAADRVRFHGEPVAIVAAETAALARRGIAAIEVDYEPLAGDHRPRGRDPARRAGAAPGGQRAAAHRGAPRSRRLARA